MGILRAALQLMHGQPYQLQSIFGSQSTNEESVTQVGCTQANNMDKNNLDQLGKLILHSIEEEDYDRVIGLLSIQVAYFHRKSETYKLLFPLFFVGGFLAGYFLGVY